MSESWSDEIYLGYSECETCGVNNNSIEVTRYEDGTYEANVSVGCYSGEYDYGITASRAVGILLNWTHLDPRVQDLIERINRDLPK